MTGTSGFVVNQGTDGTEPTPGRSTQYIETERYKYVRAWLRVFTACLTRSSTRILSRRAKELAEQFLADAKFDADPNYAESITLSRHLMTA